MRQHQALPWLAGILVLLLLPLFGALSLLSGTAATGMGAGAESSQACADAAAGSATQAAGGPGDQVRATGPATPLPPCPPPDEATPTPTSTPPVETRPIETPTPPAETTPTPPAAPSPTPPPQTAPTPPPEARHTPPNAGDAEPTTGEPTEPPQTLDLQLTPLNGSGPVGSTVFFEATVTDDGQPVVEATVNFYAEMAGADWVTLDGVTGADGTVTFEHTRELAGEETIYVEVPDGGSSVETTFTWVDATTTPGDGWQISVAPLDGSGPVGSTVGFVASVTYDDQPVSGEQVGFYAVLQGTDDYVSLEGETGAAGTVTFEHSRDVTGVDDISVYLPEFEVGADTTYTWTPWDYDLQLTLEPADSSGQVGSTVTFEATLVADGEPRAGETVYLYAALEGDDYWNDVSLSAETDESGVATFSYSRQDFGVDHVSVTTYALEEVTTDETTFTWRGPLEVNFSAGTGSGEVGTPVVVTVTVDAASSGPAGSWPAGYAPGTPTVGALASGAIGLAWPDGVSVHLLAQMPGEPDVDVTLTTDATGVATYTHTRTTPGTETLLVEATVGEETASATGSYEWLAPPPVVDIALEPMGGTGPTGQAVDFTATLTADGEPLPEETVTFQANLQGTDDPLEMEAITDANGVATFSHTRDVVGVDDIWVSAFALEQEVGQETTYTWVPPEPAITLSQSAASGQVGSPLVMTATLTMNGEAAPGIGVRFLGELGGQPDVDVTVPTNADGVATFSHTRAVPGTEQLLVGATLAGETVFATGSFEWVPVPPPVVNLTLTQSGSSGEVGTPLVWTATLTSDGSPVADADVHFLGQLAGASDVDVTLTTGADGAATHTHTRTVAGTESLQISAVVEDQSVSATGSYQWLPGEPVTPLPTDPPPTDPPVTPPPTDPPVTPPPTQPPTSPGPTAPPTATAPPVVTPPAVTPPVVTPPAVTPPAVNPPALAASTTSVSPTTTDPDEEWPTETETEEAAPPPVASPPAPVAAGPAPNVMLGRRSATPGGDLEVSGSGCAPGSTVMITLDGQTLATTTADANGGFSVRGAVANAPLGQYAVDVQCGAASGEATVDLVSTVESSTAVASSAAAAAVLSFFVLLGASVYRGAFGSLG